MIANDNNLTCNDIDKTNEINKVHKISTHVSVLSNQNILSPTGTL